MTHFAAIPTIYADVQMRSRLEAKWAAFFDLCGWRWTYEPFDLPGWIPDYVEIDAKAEAAYRAAKDAYKTTDEWRTNRIAWLRHTLEWYISKANPVYSKGKVRVEAELSALEQSP